MVFNSLPDEIISDILLRLQVKCLIRCTTVCKPWTARIKSSKFIHTHLNRMKQAYSLQGTHLVLYQGCDKTYRQGFTIAEEVFSLHCDNRDCDEYCKIDISQINHMVQTDPADPFQVFGVLDGVICLTDDPTSKRLNYVLWNPYIRKTVILPRPDVTFRSHGPFDDTVGFGFDALTNDYKVVRLVTLDTFRKPTLAEVYSLATNSWRSLGDIASCCDLRDPIANVFFNGAIHWTLKRWDDMRTYILTFDVGSEEFGEIMMPKSISWEELLISRVSVTGDGKSLALFTTCKANSEVGCYYYDIWAMKDYGVQESWTRMVTIGPEMGVLRAMGFRKSGEVFLRMTEEYGSGIVLASIDIGSRKINKLGSFPNKICQSINPYEESLVLLDVANAVSY